VLLKVLEAAEPRSVTFVLLSALTDMARLIDEQEELLYVARARACARAGCVRWRARALVAFSLMRANWTMQSPHDASAPCEPLALTVSLWR
jgi:hypothetical protein